MDGIARCAWCMKDQLYKDYHDKEWGVPSHDDRHLFEKLILETFQAGLSWYTILKKRENFREALDGFDALKMSKYNDFKVDELMQNAGIIRYRAKILAAINNAQRFLEAQKEFGTFDRFIWQFTDYKIIVNSLESGKDFKVTTKESDAMCKELKKRGFKFVGSTTCYAYMQGVGMVNDHMNNCWKK
jgi:DNA-3-methyladenine glycosylase I